MELTYARRPAEIENPPRAVEIGLPRLPLSPAAVERQAGGVVNHRTAMPRDPPQAGVVQTEIRLGQFPLDHHGTRQARAAVRPRSATVSTRSARELTPAWRDTKHRQAMSLTETVPQQVRSSSSPVALLSKWYVIACYLAKLQRPERKSLPSPTRLEQQRLSHDTLQVSTFTVCGSRFSMSDLEAMAGRCNNLMYIVQKNSQVAQQTLSQTAPFPTFR